MYACINMLIAPYFWHQTSMEVSEKRISFSRGTAGGFHIVQDDGGINIKGQTQSGTAYLTLKCKEVSENKRPVTAPALSTILTPSAFISCTRRRKIGARWQFCTRVMWTALHHPAERPFRITHAPVVPTLTPPAINQSWEQDCDSNLNYGNRIQAPLECSAKLPRWLLRNVLQKSACYPFPCRSPGRVLKYLANQKHTQQF